MKIRSVHAGLILMIVALVCGLSWARHHRQDKLPDTPTLLKNIIARVDKDHDGRISLQEWMDVGGGDLLFVAYDFDGNGYLDQSELEELIHTLPPKPNYQEPTH